MGFKRTANIQDKLIRADSSKREHIAIALKGHYKYSRCFICAQTVEGNTLEIPGKSNQIHLNTYTNCSSNCSYISCDCEKFHIGMCSRMV